MPFNGSGTFAATASSVNPAVAGTVIDQDDFNDLITELETALSLVICRDGQSTCTGSITFAQGVRINNTGLKVLDTNASHYLSIVPGSNITADRTFTLTTGDAARTLDMSAGSLTAGGGQYVFPASQNASADANTLDDYEEGTFTPTIAFGGAAVGVTYGTQTGNYTKIGNRVCFGLRLILTDNGSSSGNATVAGLPFTVGSLSASCAVRQENIDLNVAGGFYSVAALAGASSTSITILENGDNVDDANLTEADISNTAVLDISGNYSV